MSNGLQMISADNKVPVKLASKEFNINQEEQQGRGLKKDKQSYMESVWHRDRESAHVKKKIHAKLFSC